MRSPPGAPPPLRARPDVAPSVAASRATSPDGGGFVLETSLRLYCASKGYQAGENERRIPVLAPKAYIRTSRVRERGEKNEFQ